MIGRRGVKLNILNKIRNPKCSLCSLHENSVNICVMGRGNPLAPIHLVGEAPGEAEGRTGLPFMGRAGQLLNDILRELEMYNMVYISNVVRCRPPANRKPTPEEIETCASIYLAAEISVIKPKIQVLMGRTAIDYYYNGQKFQRGKPVRWVDWVFPCITIPTWHPSYLLRTQSEKWPTRKDFVRHLLTAKELGLQSGN